VNHIRQEALNMAKQAELTYLTPREAARYLHVSFATLRRASDRGEVRCVRIGKLRRYSRESLDALSWPRHLRLPFDDEPSTDR
jgi:excisionase family DNA binding protein